MAGWTGLEPATFCVVLALYASRFTQLVALWWLFFDRRIALQDTSQALPRDVTDLLPRGRWDRHGDWLRHGNAISFLMVGPQKRIGIPVSTMA
jgi:hypothetical protein